MTADLLHIEADFTLTVIGIIKIQALEIKYSYKQMGSLQYVLCTKNTK